MKKFIIRCSLFLFGVLSVVSLTAQEDEFLTEEEEGLAVIVEGNRGAKIKCEETKTYYWHYPTICFKKSDYSKEQAIAAMTLRVAKKAITNNEAPYCLNDCYEEEDACDLSDSLEVRTPGPGGTWGGAAPSSTATKWCFSGAYYRAIYTCDTCTAPPPSIICVDCEEDEGYALPHTEKHTGKVSSINNETNTTYDFSAIEASGSTAFKGSIQNVYPNPTTGLFHTEILLKEKARQIELQLTNIAGKQVFNKTYEDIPKSVFKTENDLGTLPQGVYILSIKIDGVTIGTSKLSVLK